MTLEFYRQTFEKRKNPKTKCYGIRSIMGQTDGWADMAKLIVAFRNFGNAFEKWRSSVGEHQIETQGKAPTVLCVSHKIWVWHDQRCRCSPEQFLSSSATPKSSAFTYFCLVVTGNEAILDFRGIQNSVFRRFRKTTKNDCWLRHDRLFGSHWTDFDEIWYLSYWKICREN